MPINTNLVTEKAAMRAREVAAYCSIGVSTVWWLSANDPTFAKKIRLGTKTIVFLKAEVDQWLAAKAEATR